MSLSRLTVLAILPLLACAPKEAEPDAPTAPPEPAELTIHMTENNFASPDTVAPGVTRVRIVNDGESEHHAIMVRIDSGKTMEDVGAALQANETPAWLTIVGGGGAIGKGMENVTYSDLSPGLHVLVCFLQDGPDSPPHVALGMVKPIIVAGERSLAVMPETDAEIRLVDYGFEVPTLAAGLHHIRVANIGQEDHEIFVARLPDGMTVDEFMAAAQQGGEPVGTPMGGNGALSPGGANIWQVTFTPGTYVALCFVPSPTDGAPHVMKGMAKEFTVS